MSQEASSQLLLFVLLAAGFFVLVVRPQRRRARQLRDVRAALGPGAEVVTTAGLHATVVSVEGATVRLEIAPGVVTTFAAAAVMGVLSPAAPGDSPDA